MFRILKIQGLSFSKYQVFIKATNGIVQSKSETYLVKVSILKTFVPKYPPRFKKTPQVVDLSEQQVIYKLPEIERTRNLTYTIGFIGIDKEPWIEYEADTG